MDVASDRVNRAHTSRLRLLKDMQERSALRELSEKEAQRHTATLALQNASQELASAQQHFARAEAALYQELMSLDKWSSAALDHHHLQIERLAAEVTSRWQMLDDARIAQEKAEAAASEMRAVWVKRSAASHKWQQIEDDVRRAVDIHSEAAGEIEADDDISLRYGRVSLALMSRDQIR
ncbi:hypothetical protein ILFOPFJJ_06482 [Ensifer psoraleae]|uniref:hypothetical protein n=1 Tax=Sinorhizobium psoraleae TaxID=520838 RepID=UPI001568D31A|nr:hypothetical protein [Sinorhizobium psoraleae]NRP75559.1 hypothetical protein [Sinorhizobium psoraleae]